MTLLRCAPWSALLLAALLQSCRAECDQECQPQNLTMLIKETTKISFDNCTLSTNNQTQNGSLTNLDAGTIYEINFTCLNCCGNITTKPDKVRNLTVTEITTSSISLNWTEPFGNSSSFVVQWQDGTSPLNQNVTNKNTTISNLTPGVQYKISVTAVAEDSQTKGESVFISIYTRPEKPRNITVSASETHTLNISWILMNGKFAYFQVNISNAELNYSNYSHTSALAAYLTGLSPGRLYHVVVTSVVGDFRIPSDDSSFATVPVPPDSLTIANQTNSSLWLTWIVPDVLSGAPNISFLITYNYQKSLKIKGYSKELSMLSSGTLYNITIVTVGPQDLTSTAIQKSSYTLPNPVLNVTVTPINTTSVMVKWMEPLGSHGYYWYLVQTCNVENPLDCPENNVSNSSIIVNGLTAGSKYFVNITTKAGPGSKSPAEQTFFYTIPEKVFNLTATGTTNSLNVTWTALSGRLSSYNISLFKDSVLVKEKTAPNSSTYELFEGLNPGVLYQVNLVTINGPVQNEPSTVSNATLPTPPSLVMAVSQTVHSINFTWSPPVNMSQNQYNFTVHSGNTTISIQKSWFLWEGLQSGSPYLISVVTVGVWGYQSMAVNATTYTKPYSVSNLTQTQITTDSVSLKWDQLEIKPFYSYIVQAFSSSYQERVSLNSSSTNKTVQGLQSGTNYTFTVTTVTLDGTRSESSMLSYFTRPFAVTALRALTLNTTSVYLNWSKPLYYKSYYTYSVKTILAGWITNITVQNESTVISSLIPGTNYSFCLTVIIPDSIEGEENCTHQYTKPEKAEPPSVWSDGSNSSIVVTWTKPSGNVEKYWLTLNSTGFTVKKLLNSSTTSFTFENLTAGTLYSAQLTTCSGSFCEDSDYVTNVTFPNPPGPIKILNQTTSSIQVEWGEAPLMSSGFVYRLLIHPTGNIFEVPSPNVSFTFPSLLSGIPYNISVSTVGPMSLESGSVFRLWVSTRPHMVQDLQASPQETSLTVSWNPPHEYKETYRYNVSWTTESPVSSWQFNISTGKNFTITNLVPGTLYIISVITETADGTQATPYTIQTRTGVSHVTDLTCAGPNLTKPEIWLSWKKAAGLSTSFVIQVENQNHTLPSSNCSSQEWCNYTVSNLNYSTEYHVLVWTQSSEQYSPSVLIVCTTGITEPVISKSYASMAKAIEIQYNKFSIQVSSDLLNDFSGPITHVGILLTKSLSEGEPCEKEFLTKTFDDWKSDSLEAYLTAVTAPPTRTRSASNLTVNVGTATTWNDYLNSELAEGQTYRYAIALFTSLQLNASHVDYARSVVAITNFYPSVQLPKNPVWIAIAVGATLGIFSFLLLILIGVIIYWKRLSVKKMPDIQIHSISAKVSAAMRVEDFEAYYRKQKADSNCGFAEEFEDLKVVGTSQAKVQALNPSNKPKNRYNNVLPYDSSRVKLSIIHGDPCDDYINANYMPGYQSKKEFIAAQGPLPGTVNDFWRMIWEKNVRTLVMLTRCNEQGRVKCEQYWASSVKSCGDIIVKTTSEIILDDWTIKDFDIKNVKTSEVRSVRHFHFTAWPDHGVPETTELLISFRHLVREHMDQYSRHSPTVVHCSAGVGRTGTFIAIDRLIFQIERENVVDIFGIVHNLRMHRPLMVQTEDQYVFLNQCALDFIRSRTGNNVDLIYQNTAALSIYENISPKKRGY